jgi:hypothetical protein
MVIILGWQDKIESKNVVPERPQPPITIGFESSLNTLQERLIPAVLNRYNLALNNVFRNK